jgi:hypothetical protein
VFLTLLSILSEYSSFTLIDSFLLITMPQPLLPPRGIFIPTRMIFNDQIPPAVLVTWIQLRCLAWSGWVTPPLTIAEFASLIGIHPARLHRHLSQLQDISALSWHSTKNGKLTVSFPEESTVRIENQVAEPIHPDSTIPYSQDREALDPPSYFPHQILGYLTYQKEQEGFSDLEASEDLEGEQVLGVADFKDLERCEIDHH